MVEDYENIDVLRPVEKRVEDRDEIREIHGWMRFPEKKKVLYDMNEEKLQVTKSKMSRNAFK